MSPLRIVRPGQDIIDELQRSHAAYRAQGLRFVGFSAHYRNAAANGIDIVPRPDRIDLWGYYLEVEHGLLEFEGKAAKTAFDELDSVAGEVQPWKDTFLPVVGAAGRIPPGVLPDDRTLLHAAKNIFYLECHGWLEPDEFNGVQYGWA